MFHYPENLLGNLEVACVLAVRLITCGIFSVYLVPPRLLIFGGHCLQYNWLMLRAWTLKLLSIIVYGRIYVLNFREAN